MLSSTGTDTYSAIAAGIGALKGPLHGGANIKVQEMFDCVKANVRDPHNDDELSDFLLRILKGKANDGSGLIYGMGHAVYTKSDPRAVMLKRYARQLAQDKGYGEDFELLESIERLTPEVFNTYKGKHHDICANVDLYSGIPDAGHPDRDVHAALHHCPHGRLVCAPHGGNPVLRQDYAPRLQVHRAGTSLHGADPALSAVQGRMQKTPVLDSMNLRFHESSIR